MKKISTVLLLLVLIPGCCSFVLFEKEATVIPIFDTSESAAAADPPETFWGMPIPNLWTALINSESVGNAAESLIDSVALNETRKPYAYQVIETQYWIRVGK